MAISNELIAGTSPIDKNEYPNEVGSIVVSNFRLTGVSSLR